MKINKPLKRITKSLSALLSAVILLSSVAVFNSADASALSLNSSAVELAGATLPEIIGLMNGEFSIGIDKTYRTAYSTMPEFYICNDTFLPDMKFYLSLTDEQRNEFTQNLSNGNGEDLFNADFERRTKYELKSGVYDFYGIVLTGSAKLGKGVTADMTYNEIAEASGLEFGTDYFKGGWYGYDYNSTVMFVFQPVSDMNTKQSVSADEMKNYDPKLYDITVYTNVFNRVEKDYGVFDTSKGSTSTMKFGADSPINWHVSNYISADDMKMFYNRISIPRGVEYYDKMNMLDCVAFKKNGKWGLIDYSGTILCEAKFDDIQVNAEGDMVGIGRDEQGNKTDTLLVYSNGTVNEDFYTNQFGTNGRTPRNFYWIEDDQKVYTQVGAAFAEPFSKSDLIAAQIGVKNDIGGGFTVSSASGAAIDENNPDIVLVCGGKRLDDTLYTDGGSASDGLIAMRKGDKWGYLNEKGETVIPFEYDATSVLPYKTYNRIESKSVLRCVPFEASNGYVVLCKNGKYSMRNTSGDLVIKQGTFEKMLPVYEHEGKKLAWVKFGGKWGVIEINEANIKPIEEVEPKPVDIDGDGVITSTDALEVLRMSAGIAPQTNTADIDGDGAATSADALILLRVSVGLDE